MENDTQREINATNRWGIGLLIAILVQAGAIFVWAGGIQAEVQQTKTDISKLETRVNSVDADIRAILVGIEQVKARLGIIENEP